MLTRCLSRIITSPSTSKNIQSRGTAALPSFQMYSIRRKIAEKLSNQYNEKRAEEIGPDLAALEWLMECGSTSVEMSDGQKITRIREMKEYIKNTMENKNREREAIQAGDLGYEKQWPNAPYVHILKVDASDSAVANEGFKYLKNVRRIEELKLNFCDFFGDDAIKHLAQGRPAQSLKSLEIVLNPCLTDGVIYWLQKLKSLKRAHFYFLPYVSHRQGLVRQLKLALPRCNVTFPEVDQIGFGYNDQKNNRK